MSIKKNLFFFSTVPHKLQYLFTKCTGRFIVHFDTRCLLLRWVVIRTGGQNVTHRMPRQTPHHPLVGFFHGTNFSVKSKLQCQTVIYCPSWQRITTPCSHLLPFLKQNSFALPCIYLLPSWLFLTKNYNIMQKSTALPDKKITLCSNSLPYLTLNYHGMQSFIALLDIQLHVP
jgi:hypothetical protein